MRTLGQFVKQAVRQLRGNHPLFGDPRAGQAQHPTTAQGGKLNNQRGAGFRRDGGTGGKRVKLLAADARVGDGEGSLLRLFNQRRVGVKAQVLAGDIVINGGR